MAAAPRGPSVPSVPCPSLGQREGAPPQLRGCGEPLNTALGRVCALAAVEKKGVPSTLLAPSGRAEKAPGGPCQAATPAAGKLPMGSSSKATTSVGRCSRMGGTSVMAKSSVSPKDATDGTGSPLRSLAPEESGSAAGGGTVATGTSAKGGGASRSSSTIKGMAVVVAPGGSSASMVGSPVAGGIP